MTEHRSSKHKTTPEKPAVEASPVTVSTIDWRRLHIWQIQPVRDTLLFAALFGLFWLGYVLRLVTVPILLGLLMAYLFEPLVLQMTRMKWVSRQLAAAIIIIVASFAIVAPLTLGVSFAAAQGVTVVEGISHNVGAIQASIAAPEDEELAKKVSPGAWRSIRDRIVNLRAEHAEGRTPNPESMSMVRLVDWGLLWLSTNADAIVQSVGPKAARSGADALAALAATLTSIGLFTFTLLLTFFFFFFFCTGWGRVRGFAQRFIPVDRRTRTMELVSRMNRVIAGFVRGRLIICLCQCAFYTIGYLLIGVPASLVMGVIVGVLAIVPYLSLLAAPVAIILLWLNPPGGFRDAWWWIVFAPLVVYQLGQMLDDYLLTPMIQGKATGLDTPTIVFASLTGGILLGVYGLLLAIPVAACVKILLSEVAMPKIKAWVEGRALDPLPIAGDAGTAKSGQHR